jgi:Pvc16 N-terminal domain
MSSFRVLTVASAGLRRLLWNSIRADSVTQPLVGTEDAIVFLNPTATAQDSSRRLSLWLYHLSEDEHVKNTPTVRRSDGSFQMTPLALDLYYLLTPFAASGEADHLLLGKAMQTFHDTGIARIVDTTVRDVNEELRITLFRRSLDEISQVWQALREPYRLSVCYQVKVTHIDSNRVDRSIPVVSVSGSWTPEPALSGAT